LPSQGTTLHPVDLAADSSVRFSDTSFDSGDKESADAQTEQWRNYVTKTGRLTGYIYSSRKNSPVKEESRKEIWKPAFSLNSTETIHAFHPSLNWSATDGLHNCSVNAKPKKRCSTAVHDCSQKSLTVETCKGTMCNTLIPRYIVISLDTGHKEQTPLCGSPIKAISPKHITDVEVKEDRIKMYKR